MNKRTTDIVAYLTWIGLVMAFAVGDRNGSRFHLNQALVIWLGFTVCGLLSKVLFAGWIIGIAGSLFCSLCWFIGFINAIQGVEREVPLLGQIHLI